MQREEKTWYENHRQMSRLGNKLADAVTGFVGSWAFVIIHIIWFALWIILDVEPFPFGLLTMIVSLEAILLSTFIMMSQNRQAHRDRAQAEVDLQTDRAAKNEIEELEKLLHRIEDEKLDKIINLLNKN